MSKNKLLIIFLSLLPFFGLSQTITVDDTQTVEDLVDGILVTGDCSEVDNITSPNNSEEGGENLRVLASFDASNAAFPLMME